MMFRKLLAAEALARLCASAVLTAATVVLSSTTIVAVMLTLAETTVIATASNLTPTKVAIFCCRPAVSA